TELSAETCRRTRRMRSSCCRHLKVWSFPSLYRSIERPSNVGHASPLYRTINSAGVLTPGNRDSSFVLKYMDGPAESRKTRESRLSQLRSETTGASGARQAAMAALMAGVTRSTV